MSVFDILLQQVAGETPAQVPVAAPVALDTVSALMAETLEVDDSAAVETADTPAEQDGAAAAEAVQIVLALAAPVVAAAQEAGPSPDLSETPVAIDEDAKAKAEPALPLTVENQDAVKDGGPPGSVLIGKRPDESDRPARNDAKSTLDKTREAVASVDSQAVQPAADPRTVSAASETPAPAPSAFSLQAITDAPGSYTATGASTAAASNLSKAAVESLSALSMQISKKLEQGNTKFAIELYPADLGKVEVSMHIGRDGKTTAHLTFDSPVTAASFSASEPELRQQLADAGLSLDKDALSFSSRDGGSSLAQGNGQNPQSQARHAARALEAARKVADESDLDAALNTAATAAIRNRAASTLALNLIV